MATVNKKFSVKNGLAVDGNVAVSNIASFNVTGPSSASLTFTLANVTSATINSENIATETWVGNQGYLTSFSETDPVFTASAAGGITGTQVTNWDTAYGWGNHASAGYLTSFTETDPVFTASAAGGITGTQVTNWDTAYGWGNHASAGYLTSAVESISSGDSNLVFSASSGTVTVNLAANVTVSQDLTVTGNLTVNGNTTTINTETLAVEDNVVLLNKNVTGTPTVDAGIEVERGDYTNAKIYWNETANEWYVSTPGDSNGAATETAIALAGQAASDAYATISDGSNTASASGLSTITFSGANGISTVVDNASDTVTVGLPSTSNIAVNQVTVNYYSRFISNAGSLTTSTENVVLSWGRDLARSGKFVVEMTNGTDIHALEMLVTVDGAYNVYLTEYAEVISNVALGETNAVYNSGTASIDITINPGSNIGVWGTVLGNLVIVD